MICSDGTRNIMQSFFFISVSVNYFYQYPFIYSSYYPKEEKERNYEKIPIDMQQERAWMVAKQKAHKQTDTK